jgi:hypothetical protein
VGWSSKTSMQQSSNECSSFICHLSPTVSLPRIGQTVTLWRERSCRSPVLTIFLSSGWVLSQQTMSFPFWSSKLHHSWFVAWVHVLLPSVLHVLQMCQYWWCWEWSWKSNWPYERFVKYISPSMNKKETHFKAMCNIPKQVKIVCQDAHQIWVLVVCSMQTLKEKMHKTKSK